MAVFSNLFRRPKANGESPSGTAPEDAPPAMAALLALVREQLAQPYAGPFRPLTAAPNAVRTAADAVLDEVAALTPASQADYFLGCRARYLGLLGLLLPTLDIKKSRPGCRVLDVGCAPGHMAMALSLLGAEVRGIDLNEHYLPKYPSPEWIERLGIQIFDIERGDLPFEDASFDLVLFTEVLEHIAIRPPAELVAEFRRVLRPGGHLLLSVPNLANASQVLALCGLHNVMWSPELFYGSTDRHNREYVPTELSALIGAQFERAEYFMTNTEPNWNGRTNVLARQLSREAAVGAEHPIFYNTLIAWATRDAAPAVAE